MNDDAKKESELRDLNEKERKNLVEKLEKRFSANMNRHKGVSWQAVLARLERDTRKMGTLYRMEETGGEPDVVLFDAKNGEYVFFDCSVETPVGRRGLCYDREALDSRKEHKPEGNAIDMAHSMGIEILTEDEYRFLQSLGVFDIKTSSWVKTPPEIRALGGALFCDRRYNHVFVYHNGASSYYGVRGFRGSVRV